LRMPVRSRMMARQNIMNEFLNEIRKAREQSRLYTLIKIDMHSQLKTENTGCLFVLEMDDDPDQVYYAGSYSVFGEWLSRKRVKIGDKLKIKVTLGNEIEYAEIVD
jgi:hypothetical protein